jgi:hypothetical protein
MDRTHRKSYPALPLALLRIAAFLAMACDTAAQAWVPGVGVGSVTLSYQRITNTGHHRSNGFLAEVGPSLNMGLYLEAEYAVTNRLSLAAGLPYVFAKYTAPRPPPPPIPILPWDQCHCWQSGWQDWGFTARYNVVTADHGAFVLTPSVSVGLPSHDYEFRGEAVLGRHLKEVRIAMDAGLRLDRISRNLSVQGRYSYAFVERVIGIPNNRSNANVEGAYLLLKGKLAARGFASWQRTHGGLLFGSPSPATLVFPGEVDTPERLFEHDRILRDNNFHAGGGVSYSFPQLDVFAFYTAFVSGTDTHAGRALTVGVSWPFELSRARRH